MSRKKICTYALLSQLLFTSVGLMGCDDGADAHALRDRLREVEAENQRLRENEDRLADQSPPPNERGKEQSQAESFTCGGTVANILAMMLQEYDLHPEKDIVNWVAKSFDWTEMPKHLAEAGNADVAFSGPIFGHRLIVAKGDIDGVFTIAAGEGFVRDEFLSSVKEYCDINVFRSERQFGTLSEMATISTSGREIGMLIINSSDSQATAGAGTVTFMPSRVAREFLDESQSP